MISFLTRRMFQSLFVMLAVMMIAFVIFRFVGDPVNAMLPENATTEDRQILREQLGLDLPLSEQLTRFLSNVAHGEFGTSYRNKRQVSNLIVERVPATIELVVCAMALALIIGIPMGVLTAIRHRSVISNLFQIVSLIGVSVPTFVTGILLILIFSVWLDWLPSFGRGEVVQIGWWSTGFLTASGLKALILPSIMLGLFQMTLIMRLVRSEMLGILRTDYIRFAKARGLTDRIIYFRHALRNTLIPVVTIAGMQFGSMFAFSIITETVFQWPGMGLLLIQAINFADIPVMSAYLILISFIFVVINMIVDLLYLVLDPRLSITNAHK